MRDEENGLERAIGLWRASSCAIALTGAGMSVASGIPDFRSPQGLWSRYDPLEVATLQALRANPRRVWEFLVAAALCFGEAEPNPGHTALAELEARGKLAAVITQNIDNLHQRAGSTQVIEFHGNGSRFYCMRCGKHYDPEPVAGLTPEELPWTCSECQGVIRPDFVFFGEGIDRGVMAHCASLVDQADFCLIAGTSGEVAPANAIPHQVKARGGAVVELNLGFSTYGDMPDVVLHGRTEELLPRLAQGVLA